MMKKSIISLLFAFIAIFASAQCEAVNEINENFDTWSEIDPCWNVVSNGGMVYAEENVTFYSFMSPNISMFLISPEIVNGDYVLTFDAGTFSLAGEQPEGVTVEVGTLTSNEDTSSYVAVSEAVALNNVFQTIETPVSFSGEAKYIAIKISTVTPHSAAGIDNFTLQAVTAGVNDVQTSKVQAYPNPVVNQLNLNSDQNIQEVKIFSTTGQLVQNQKLNGKKSSVNLSDLKPGVYVVQVVTEKGVETLKVVKK